MNRRINKLLEDVRVLSNGGTIVIYGAGLLTKYLVFKTPIKDFNIVGIADNDPKKWGSFVGGFKVYKPEDILDSADFVLVGISNFNEELAKYLKSQNKKALFINRVLYYLLSEDIHCDEKIGDVCIKFKTKDVEPELLKILVLKLDYFGDTMLSLPFLYEIRAKYKYAFIDAICTAENYKILKELGIFSKLYISKEFSRSEEGISTDEILKSLDKYDILIDIGFGPDTRHLIRHIKADYKIALESFDNETDSMLDIKIPYISKDDTVTKLLLDALKVFPDFKSKKTKTKKVKNIAIFPSPSQTSKRWVYFKEFIGLLEKEDIESINIYSDSKNLDIDSPKVHYHINLDFRTLLDSLAKNDLAITVDSFGAHISSYAGLPVICIFFDSSSLGFSPSYSESILVFKPQDMELIKYDENIYCYKYQPSDINPDLFLNIVKRFYNLDKTLI